MPKQIVCKICQSNYHYQSFCPRKPKNINRNKQGKIRARGKQYAKWNETRRAFLQHMSDGSGYYSCHYCRKPLTIDEVTVDHKKPRGSHPHLRYEFSNLVISCWICNGQKGSQSYEKFVDKKLDTKY